MDHNLFDSRRPFTAAGKTGSYYSLATLEKAGLGKVSRLPVSLRIVLESLLRNCDGKRVTEQHVRSLAAWQPNAERSDEIPFVVARILLQDMSGFPTLADFAMLRTAAQRMGADPAIVEPLVPADMVVDHSVEVDVYNTPDAVERNLDLEFKRNTERYQFLKWCRQGFSGVRVVPPGNGICHQLNLEYLARGVCEKDGVYYPDTLVGTDSHTTMINGIGIVGWGVGGIEGTAGMLGQPIYFLTPDVVGVHMTGKLNPGVTATDLVLTVTELLRKANVVGKFVEYFGEGAASLSATDRAVVANMSPDYGATLGYFALDEKTIEYMRLTGRDAVHVATIENYYRTQGLFGIPRKGDCDYTKVVELDLAIVQPSVSGPRRPQDRINLGGIKDRFKELYTTPVADGGYGKVHEAFDLRHPTTTVGIDIGHADVLIAAITSCTNTSNPRLLLGAGLLAKKAVEKGLKVHPRVKTSFAPGSRVSAAYLRDAGLLPFLEKLGFSVVAYGCTSCAGTSGPLDEKIENSVLTNDLITCAVLSGNRNFEARIHPTLKANFLMSPPLVVAFAIAGTVDVDMTQDAIGSGTDGKPVYLKDIWPSDEEIAATLHHANNAENFKREYSTLSGSAKLWDKIPEGKGAVFQWNNESTFLKEGPFLDGFKLEPPRLADLKAARPLALYGDSITTDHISSVAPIKLDSPAGQWLQRAGVPTAEFGNYGVRRCNHEVMMRGTFTNARIRNLMAPGTEGGVAIHQPSGEKTALFYVAQRYQKEGVPMFVFGGEDYGTGSSRDAAAKGTMLLGIKAVIARSFERIHRSNLVGMGVLPCQFMPGTTWQSLDINGTETFDLLGISNDIKPMQDVTLLIKRTDGSSQNVTLRLRVDTAIEVEYLRHGGILPYMLREMLTAAA